MTLTPEEFDALTRLDLHTFVRRVFKELNPTRPFHAGPHIDYVCAEVATLYTGETRRLVLNLPPRNLKSVIATVAFVAWVLGNDPSKRFLLVTYGGKLARSFGEDILRVMRSAWYGRLFPATRFGAGKPRYQDFSTTANGRVKVESIQGGLLGFGADYIIIDDPVKPLDALSEHTRKKVNETIQNSVLSRQDGVASARVMLIMQRLHEEDVTGYLMGIQPWRQIRLPAIAEEDEIYPYTDAFGRKQAFRRRRGEALNPPYEPLPKLLEQKELVGDYFWAAQYQLRPAPLEGAIFKIEKFKRLPRADFPKEMEIVVASWDTASRDGLRNDYSVCFIIGVAAGVRYVLDRYRGKLEFPALRREVIRQRDWHRPNHIIIEAKGSGQELIPELRDLEVYGVEAALPTVSKVVRAEGQTALLEAGEVVFPSDAPWLEEMLTEFALFPNGRHDDQVDALCQGLQWLRAKLHEPYGVAFARQEMERAGLQEPKRPRPMPVESSPPPVATRQSVARDAWAKLHEATMAPPVRVRLRAPDGISHVIVEGRQQLIPPDRVVEVLPADVGAFVNCIPAWTRV